MKHRIIITAVALVGMFAMQVAASAEQKAKPSREATINYINKTLAVNVGIEV